MRMLPILLILLATVATRSETLPGQQAFEAGDFALARAEIAKSDQLENSAALKLLLVEIDLTDNKLDQAETHLNETLNLFPDNPDAHALRGQLMGIKASRASFFRAGKFARESRASLERALELDPEHEDALIGLIRYLRSAPKLFGGDIDQAIELSGKLESIDEVAGKLELAELYRAQKQNDKQIQIIKELTESHPDDPRAPVALGFVYQADSDWAEARRLFKQAASSQDKDPDSVYSIQMARYQIGRTAVRSKTTEPDALAEAVQSLTQYLDGPRRPGLPATEWAHYRRGLLYERQGDRQSEAQQDFEQAAASEDPDLKRALSSR